MSKKGNKMKATDYLHYKFFFINNRNSSLTLYCQRKPFSLQETSRNTLTQPLKLLNVRLFEVRLFEVRLFEFRLFEVRLFEVRLFEVRLFEVKLFEVKLFEVRLFKVRLG
jgi:hypothetical protein